MPINTCVIEGNLTKDGELRQSMKGLAILNFTLAHNIRHKNQETGEWEQGETSYFRCVMFGRQAEALYTNGYFTKGRRTLVQGNLRQRSYEKDGEKKTVYELVVSEVFFGQIPNKQAPATVPHDTEEFYDEDLPF